MSKPMRTYAIIDLGSNSIRLAIYEVTPNNHYRLIYENKESARLSGKIGADGSLPLEAISSISPLLSQFRRICERHQCQRIELAATAAIRNAANQQAVIDRIYQETGLPVRVLSGEDEAYYGFVGVASAISAEDGFIIDIGGGSTEITLFRNRQVEQRISLPLGAVNALARFGQQAASAEGRWTPESVGALHAELDRLLAGQDWIEQAAGLPLIGLGGTARMVGKIDQRRRHYPLTLTHYYKMPADHLHHFYDLLPTLTMAERRQINGLSKSRVDLIVPGVIMLQHLCKRMKAPDFWISGVGLREGLLLEMLDQPLPLAAQVPAFQIGHALAFAPYLDHQHLSYVRSACQLLGEALDVRQLGEDCPALLDAAALLYPIGIGIGYHQYEKHTFYALTHTPTAGLDHRLSIMCAHIASGRYDQPKAWQIYAGLLQQGDNERIRKLGILLHIATLLDQSQSQVITDLRVKRSGDTLILDGRCTQQAPLESRGLAGIAKAFRKIWGIKLEWAPSLFSTN